MDECIENISGVPFLGLRTPCNTMVAGVSSSGKMTLVHRILRHRNALYTLLVAKVLYCMSVDQKLYGETFLD